MEECFTLIVYTKNDLKQHNKLEQYFILRMYNTKTSKTNLLKYKYIKSLYMYTNIGK